jgi:hypothetical protein
MVRIKSLNGDESSMVQIHTSVTRETERWLDQTSRDSGCSISAVVRDAIRLYVRAHDKGNPLAQELEKEAAAENKAIAGRNKGVIVTNGVAQMCPRGYTKCYLGGCTNYDSCESPMKIDTEEE